MTYRRIETEAQLPPAGPWTAEAREKSDLDFKKFADESKICEHAKDVAAFANVLGGVILVGADDRGGQVSYPGVQGQSVQAVKNIYEHAAMMCSPTIAVDVVPIMLGNGETVAAVNVDPHVDQVVAAPAGNLIKDAKELKDSKAWVFPIRRASQTENIEPKDLAMYMNREVRRALLLLEKIPPDCRKKVVVHFHFRDNFGLAAISRAECQLDAVSVEQNSVQLKRVSGPTTVWCRVPLLDIIDVWESQEDTWDIKIRGTFDMASSDGKLRFNYRPMPT